MTDEQFTSQNTSDDMQSDHEEKVAEFEEERVGNTNAADPTSDPGRRPTSVEDQAADRDETYEDPTSTRDGGEPSNG